MLRNSLSLSLFHENFSGDRLCYVRGVESLMSIVRKGSCSTLMGRQVVPEKAPLFVCSRIDFEKKKHHAGVYQLVFVA